ncbi:MAG TPA: transcriptional regulator [Armatimonadota bacterium]|nr:transcriptional regulator [Armatimonadota bacterium]
MPEAFQSRIRLAIIAALASGPKTFNELKALTGATDGNLSVHLTKLEADKYLMSEKSFRAKKPLTTYTITEQARNELSAYVALLEQTLCGGQAAAEE